jgi:hypothetical protein
VSEYVVIQARYEGRRIVEAEALMMTVAGAENPTLFSRSEIIESLERGRDFWRVGHVKKKPYGEYGRDVLELDEPIHVVVVGRETYLRKDTRTIREDDLGDLPDLALRPIEEG